MKRQKWLHLVALVVVLTLTLVGCSKGGGSASSSKTSGGKDLKLIVRNYPSVQSPFYKTSKMDPLIYGLLFDTLLVEDADKNLQPLIADEWKMSDDKKELTFKLNPNMKFHNGESVLSKDVWFTFTLLGTGNLATQLTQYLACFKSVEQVSDLEAKFILDGTCPDAARDFGTRFPIINESSWWNKGGYTVMQTEATKQSGSGPFDRDYSLSKTGERLVLKATGTHPRRKPIVDTVTFQVVQDENTPESSVKIEDVYPLVFGQ